MRKLAFIIGYLTLATSAMAAPALVKAISAGPGTAGTSQAINTTGANFYVIAVSGANGMTPTVYDSVLSTWTVVVSSGLSTNTGLRLYYVTNPTTSATYTASISGASFSSLCFGSFSGMATTTPYQVSNSTAVTNGVTMTYPSLTPTGSSLFTSGASVNGAETISINDSYVIASSAPFASGTAYGCALYYLASSSANGPTWTFSVNTDIAGALAVFSASSGTTQIDFNKQRRYEIYE